uniref:Uncharacterized protein n=1 Tax=Vitis vinifera TaxID=29760 RepID=A5ANW3_VITVI|nr:hypothetical protein VITISV_043227 [Vitis vinifera]
MAQSPDHFSAPTAAASLYCAEDVEDVVSWDSDTWISDPGSSPLVYAHSPPFDESTIERFFGSEPDHRPMEDYLCRCRDRSVDVTSRQDSINWILKVHAYYHFRPVTAILSVNYLDRFLSRHALPQGNGWPFQLLSVACLSLAAKMEETHVPLLLDLQMFQTKFVFEPKTIQRMELWVMANLNWRLRSVTPFDFIDYFASKLPCSSASRHDLLTRVFSVSADLILNTTRVVDFLGFSPSVIAAAAVISASGKREVVRSCHQLMEEYLIDTCPSAPLKDLRPEPPAPASPVGVLDAAACGSCETRSENPGLSEANPPQPPPPNKRPRFSAPGVQQP